MKEELPNSEIEQYKLFVSLLEKLNPKNLPGLLAYTKLLKEENNTSNKEN